MERIGLKNAIGALREELSEAILAATNEDLKFQVGEITLEFQVEVELAAEGSGKVNFWVVEIGGSGSRTSSTTHKVSVPLKPTTVDGQPVLTGSPKRITRD